MKDFDLHSTGLSVIDREAIMNHALDLARQALIKGELPIAAVLADGDAILYEGHNEIASTNDLDAHAEAGVVRGAKYLLRKMKLTERNRLTLYSTLEPCFMCCGIAMTFNLGTVCYALESPGDGVLPIIHAWEKKSEQLPFYRAPKIIGGVLRSESAALFYEFTLLYPDSRFAKWARQLSSVVENTPSAPLGEPCRGNSPLTQPTTLSRLLYVPPRRLLPVRQENPSSSTTLPRVGHFGGLYGANPW